MSVIALPTGRESGGGFKRRFAASTAISRSHAGVEEELAGWLRARAWVSVESHSVLFAHAVEHLIGEKVLLPGLDARQ